MTWNYRVARRKHAPSQFDPDGTVEWGIVEAYDGGSSWTENFVDVSTDDDRDPIVALRWQLTAMLEALDKPVIGD